jgi:hypothetical protein
VLRSWVVDHLPLLPFEKGELILFSVHVSRFAMLPTSRSIPIIEIGEILQQEAMDETVPTPNAP